LFIVQQRKNVPHTKLKVRAVSSFNTAYIEASYSRKMQHNGKVFLKHFNATKGHTQPTLKDATLWLG
jgi:hypothetical protein|tara:strand:+ start:427 stop:627 length:201 start_codon:yes stop_codon:yes gene_type:complete